MDSLAELVQEAITSFRLSTRIFSLLQPPKPSPSSSSGNAESTLQQRRHPANLPVDSKDSSSSSPPTAEEKAALLAKQQALDNPPLPANTEWGLKIAMFLFVLVAYKIMSHLMLEEGEGLDRAGSRLAKFLGKE